MDATIIVAIISFVGTVLESVCGILASNKLMNYRIDKLEQKVNKHNNLIERMYDVENRAKSNTHRLDKIEQKVL